MSIGHAHVQLPHAVKRVIDLALTHNWENDETQILVGVLVGAVG
jgi:hypothetical protein